MRQRPSLFNYGTQSFVTSRELLCHAIDTSPGLPTNQPHVALQPPLPVPGTGGAWGMEYCMQLAKLRLDFHPGQIALPPQLRPPLEQQKFALQLEVCGGIACPSPATLAKIAAEQADDFPPISPQAALRGEKQKLKLPNRPLRTVPMDRERIHCFCLDLFAVASFRRDQNQLGPILAIEPGGIEIVDIKPAGLEDSIECLIAATLSLGVLPRVRIALDDVALAVGSFGNLVIGFTPISNKVPFNPSVANNHLAVFVDADLN